MANGVRGVVVTYGNRSGTCIRSINAAIFAGVEQMVVVANGVEDADLSELKQFAAASGGAVELLVNSKNLGSAPAYAQGMRRALRGEHAEFLWMLDDDNVPSADCLATQLRLSRELAATPACACAISAFRPAIKQHKLAVSGLGSRAYPRNSSFMYFDLIDAFRRIPTTLTTANDDVAFEVPYGPYGGLLLPVELIDLIGLPREDFVLYEDDTEYLSRIVEVGRKLWLAKEAKVTDVVENWLKASPGPGPRRLLRGEAAAKLYYSTRNRTFFDSRRLGVNRVRLAVNAAAYIAALLLSCRRRSDLVALRLMLRAMRNGLMGRLGPCLDLPLQ